MGQQNPETCSYIGTVSTPYHEWNIYLVGSLNPAKIKHIIWMSWVWQWETPWVGETTACPNLQGISFNDKKTFSFKKNNAQSSTAGKSPGLVRWFSHLDARFDQNRLTNHSETKPKKTRCWFNIHVSHYVPIISPMNSMNKLRAPILYIG